MKNKLPALIIISFVCLAGFACKENSPTEPKPLAPVTELEGNWGGRNADQIDLTNWRYLFKRDSITIWADSIMTCRGTFSLDTAALPRAIDIHIAWSATSADAGKTVFGIYAVFANILHISADKPGTARPGAMYTDTIPTISFTLMP